MGCRCSVPLWNTLLLYYFITYYFIMLLPAWEPWPILLSRWILTFPMFVSQPWHYIPPSPTLPADTPLSLVWWQAGTQEGTLPALQQDITLSGSGEPHPSRTGERSQWEPRWWHRAAGWQRMGSVRWGQQSKGDRLTDQSTYSLPHSFTHLLIYSLTLTHWLVYSLTYFITHTLTHTLTKSFYYTIDDIINIF